LLFNWSDPRRGLGGQYRLNIHSNPACATLYTWTQSGGHMLDHRRCRTGCATPSVATPRIVGLALDTQLRTGRVGGTGGLVSLPE
jgi:hypothetical protein